MVKEGGKTLSDLQNEVKKGKIYPVYGFFGTDSFQRQEAIRILRDQLIAPGQFVNYETFAGTGIMNDVLMAAKTLPWGGGRKLVVAKNVENLSESEIPKLIQYLAKPNPTTTLIFEGENSPCQELSSWLEKTGGLFNLKPLKIHEVTDWLVQKARNRGYILERQVAELITESIGTDLGRLEQELEKIIMADSHLSPPSTRRQEIRQLLAGTGIAEIWDLFHQIGQRNLPQALTVLNKLLSGGEPPLKILTQLANHLQKLWEYSHLTRQGRNPPEIGQLLGIRHPFALKRLAEEAQAYSPIEIKEALNKLAAIDHKLKLTSLPARILLENFLVQLILGERQNQGTLS